MDIYSVLLILCVSVAGTAFLSHAIGYRRGEVAARRENSRKLRDKILEHQNKIGL